MKSAVESYRRAIEIDPQKEQAFYRLGNILSDVGDVKGAIENYRRAFNIDPCYFDAFF